MREAGSALKGRHQTEMTNSSDEPQVRLHPVEGGGRKARELVHQNHLNREEAQVRRAEAEHSEVCA